MSAGSPGYSPLPQSNSDSDGSEEEELHISLENKFTSRAVDVKVSKSKTFNELKKNVINYKPLHDERRIEETLTKFQSGLDEIVIKKSNTSEIFSTSRKICFVFSLLLCVFTTVAFLWVLPCDIESCPNVADMNLVVSDAKSDNYTWKKILPNFEIIGPCSLVSDSFSTNQNFVFLAKRYSLSNQNQAKNFLFSMKGKAGSLNWSVPFENKLISVDCTLIDIDLNGLNDCVLFGKNYIITINSISGQEMWKSFKKLTGIEPTYLNFPVALPDIDNDGVKDLLLSYSFSSKNENQITIVSGKTGKIISRPYKIKFCETFHNLKLLNSTSLYFTCHNFTKESLQMINLSDMFKTIEKVNFSNWKKLEQHKEFSNTVFLNNLQLSLENRGHCPETCSVFVKVEDKHKGLSNKPIYNFNGKSTLGMIPVKFRSKHMSGFILKLWEWNGETEKFYFQNRNMCPKQNSRKCDSPKSIPRRSKSLSAASDLDNEMLHEDEQIFKRDKRTADKSHKQQNGTNLRLITEILVKLTFNDTHVTVRNLYKDEIIQICEGPHVCHPNANQKIPSTLVGSFNGSEKLIIFTSENVMDSKNKSWQMQSKIQMLDCE